MREMREIVKNKIRMMKSIYDIKNKKIAILTPTYFLWSGIDNVAKYQAEKLCKKNDVCIYAFEGDIKPTKYRIVYFGHYKSDLMKRIYRLFFIFFTNARKYYQHLADKDIIISHNYPMDSIAARAKKEFGCKYIAWFHGLGYISISRKCQ